MKTSTQTALRTQDDTLISAERISKQLSHFDDLDFRQFPDRLSESVAQSLADAIKPTFDANCWHLLRPLRRFAAAFKGFLERNPEFLKAIDFETEVPGRRVIEAWEELASAFAEGPMRPGIEPVSELLIQLKDYPEKHSQIARMFGKFDADEDRWSGFFFHPERGTPLPDLIEKEGREPGSVVPLGWDPRNERLSAQRAADIQELQGLKEFFVRHLKELRGIQIDKDPATVEQLLREGQFPDVIANVKGVSEASVRAKAAQLGIVISERDEQLQAAFIEYQAVDDAKNQVYQDAMSSQPSTPAFDRAGFGDDEKPTEASQDLETPDESESESEESEESFGTLDRDSLYAFLAAAMSEEPGLNASSAVRKLREQKIEASAIMVGRLIAQIKAEAAEV